jgi:predicted alpha/beta superfamily hydrolase
VKGWEWLLLGGKGGRLTTSVDGEEYEAFTYVPPGDGPFPLLYVLDARGTFLGTVAAARTLEAIMHGGVGHVAVVGVGRVMPEGAHEDFAQRILDFSPTDIDGPEGRGILPTDLPLGGGPAFLKVLVDHVIPLVESTLPVDPTDRAIAGWSMSGLFAAWATVSRPDLFRRCLLVSPSTWFDNEALTAHVRQLPDGALSAQQLYACAGEHEGKDWSGQFPPMPEGYEWPPDLVDMQAVAEHFADAARDRGARATFEVLPGESHGTIWWSGVTRGLIDLYRTV